MRSPRLLGILGVLVVLGVIAGLWLPRYLSEDESPSRVDTSSTGQTTETEPAPAESVVPTVAPEMPPLTGKLIIIDPGHQIGNSRHTREINKQVPAGNGTTKACNTTGTSTNDGYAEATFNVNVAVELKRELEELGATVQMTRDSDDVSKWGPCVDVRGAMGNEDDAAAKISIHGDGSSTGHHGFHIIVSTVNKDLQAQSTALAEHTIAALEGEGFSRSNYIGNGTALSLRPDIATVNLSEMPTIMAELGNMRNASDAAVMKSSEGHQRYAKALAEGLVNFIK